MSNCPTPDLHGIPVRTLDYCANCLPVCAGDNTGSDHADNEDRPANPRDSRFIARRRWTPTPEQIAAEEGQPAAGDQRQGDWMQTFTGVAFYPLDPRGEDVHPRDIAHALAHLCRYAGHVKRFYSVAEHCVLMSRAVAPEFALWALLHDATEAYIVDVPRPLKRYLPEYQSIEVRVMESICDRFKIDYGMPAEVKDADNRILLTERAALLGPSPRPWHSYLETLETLEPLDVEIGAWGPAEAEVRYLDRLAELWAADV